MSRHRGFLASIAAVNRAIEREQRARERETARATREYQRELQQNERDRKLALKEQAVAYRERRENEVEQLNADLEERVERLRNVLTARPRAALYAAPDARLKPETVVARAFARLRQTHVAADFNPESVAGRKPLFPDPEAFRPVVPPQPGCMQ